MFNYPLDLKMKKENIINSKYVKILEECLRISQQHILLHYEKSPVGIIEFNTDFEFITWNTSAERIFGYTKKEVINCNASKKILPESARTAVSKVWENLMANKGGNYSLNENLTKDGRTILCEWHNTPLLSLDGTVIGVSSLVEDVTVKSQNEENSQHAQRIYTLGKLTSGIAHDFNNMLGVILGYSELLIERLDDGYSELIKYSNEIHKAGHRSKKLTSKLLELSRKTKSHAQIVNINSLLCNMEYLLEKTLTLRIKLEMSLEESLWPTYLEEACMVDAILNISINAMHAMPDGGSLALNTCNMHLMGLDAENINAPPGDYILLSITDTGNGMDKQTLQKIFNPFFTTKGSKGTGLGMSQVYEFVTRSNGNIQVFSTLGQGTRITIYLPRYQESTES